MGGIDPRRPCFLSLAILAGASIEGKRSRMGEVCYFVLQIEPVISNLLHPGLQPSTFCSSVLGDDPWGSWQEVGREGGTDQQSCD